jgi:hypothetical protein
MDDFNRSYLLLPIESVLPTSKILVLKRPKTIENAHKTIENAHETVRNRHANGQESLGMFEPQRSNALKRILENVHVSKTKETLFILKTIKKCLIFKILQKTRHLLHNSNSERSLK